MLELRDDLGEIAFGHGGQRVVFAYSSISNIWARNSDLSRESWWWRYDQWCGVCVEDSVDDDIHSSFTRLHPVTRGHGTCLWLRFVARDLG